MKWSLFLLFCIVVAILALFKSYDEFKGGRGGGRWGGSGRRGPFTILDAVVIVLLLFWFYTSHNR
jgi:hypothetical protein